MVNVNDVAEYIRLGELTDEDEILLPKLLDVAKNFVSSYTGIPIEGEGESFKDFPDFDIVIMILCQDMYDNRTLYVDKTNLNKVVETILNMHSRNLL